MPRSHFVLAALMILTLASSVAQADVLLSVVTVPPGARLKISLNPSAPVVRNNDQDEGLVSPITDHTVPGGSITVFATFADGRSVSDGKYQLTGKLTLTLTLPPIPKAPPGLKVRFERPTPDTYRIVHTWKEGSVFRPGVDWDDVFYFIVGDRKGPCRHPFDYFVLPGQELRRPILRANTCHNGRTYYATRVVRPGDSWTVEGQTDDLELRVAEAIKSGKAGVRYCALPDDYLNIDPAIDHHQLPEDGFWWGCVDAEIVPAAATAAPPPPPRPAPAPAR